MHREENKVMGQGAKVNKKILFTYTGGMFLPQIKHSTCRRKSVQKYHTQKTEMLCHQAGPTGGTESTKPHGRVGVKVTEYSLSSHSLNT